MFTCEICKQVFMTAKGLSNHKKVHEMPTTAEVKGVSAVIGESEKALSGELWSN